jgi:uncharacterized protein YndB with AHSA1/START domain
MLISLAESGRINEEANIRDKQSTIINARAEMIWKTLSDIKNWHQWNEDIASVRLSTIEVGEEFQWKLSGQKITSIFRKIQKEELLTWTSTMNGKKVINVWRLEPTDGNQTIVTIEQSMEGFKTLFYSHQKLHNTLLNWLARLKQCTERSAI